MTKTIFESLQIHKFLWVYQSLEDVGKPADFKGERYIQAGSEGG